VHGVSAGFAPSASETPDEDGAALLIAGVMLLVVVAMRFPRISRTLLFWAAFVLTRPLGASVGDTFSKPIAKGGLGYGTQVTSAVLAIILIAMIGYSYARRPQSRRRAEA
jgi:uncharacterized membrane-anchored protein